MEPDADHFLICKKVRMGVAEAGAFLSDRLKSDY